VIELHPRAGFAESAYSSKGSSVEVFRLSADEHHFSCIGVGPLHSYATEVVFVC